MPTDFTMTITPLGGLGEIGINCQLWDTGQDAVLLDCGLMFPDELQMGVDMVIPPMEPIKAVADRLRAVVLTHGHEDHIGAVPWLVTFIDGLHIYGSPFTLTLVKRKLEERGLSEGAKLHPVPANATVEIGPITLHFIPVAHSIPQSYAIAADTPLGKILHTGDFKFESHAADGVGTDTAALRRFAGRDGIRLLLCDSTNAESEGATPSEQIVADEFRRIFEAATGRIIVTTFSSHIDRIHMIFQAAEACGRTVIVSGRRLLANIEAARDALNMDFPEELYTDQTPPDLPPERTVIVATGSQGEALSALSRIVRGEHKRLAIAPGDSIILSSRVIPGNARAVNRMVNQIIRMGARVFHADTRPVHVSGHGCRDDIRRMIALLKPRFFIPIHGECRHLAANRDLAMECCVTPNRAVFITDGQPVTLLDGAIRIEECITAEPLLVDGKGVGDLSELALHERQLMSDNGVLVAALTRNRETGMVLSGPVLTAKGLMFEDDPQDLIAEACRLAEETAEAEAASDSAKLQDRLRSVLRSHFRRSLGRDPVVIPVVIE